MLIVIMMNAWRWDVRKYAVLLQVLARLANSQRRVRLAARRMVALLAERWLVAG